jgi:hypothetical protein
MIYPGGGEQHRFAERAQRRGASRKQKVPQPLRARRPAWLARRRDFDPGLSQPAREKANLRRLAGALASLESDETAP